MDDNALDHVPLSLLDEFLFNNKYDDVLAQMRSYTPKQQRNVDLESRKDWSVCRVEDRISFKYDLPRVEYAFGYNLNVEEWMGSRSPETTLSRIEGGGGSSPEVLLRSLHSTPPPPISSHLNESVEKSAYPNINCGNIWLRSYAYISWQQFQEILLKKQDLISKQIAGVWEGQKMGRDGEVIGLSPSVWPSLQEANGLKQISKKKHQRTMSAPALISIGAHTHMAKTDRLGTGVFLPPDTQKHPPPSLSEKKKPQPVLIPARVVKTLNLNMDEIKSKVQSQLQITSQQDGASKPRRKNQRNKMTQKTLPLQDTRLPLDWTY